MNWLKEKKHKVIVAVLIFILLPLAAYAQQEVLVTGQDSNGNTRAIKVDEQGRMVTATTESSSSTTSGASVYTPTGTTTTLAADSDACTGVGDTDCTTILAATELLSWRRLTLYVANTGSNTLTDCVVSVSADGTNWVTWDTNTFDAQGAGVTRALAVDGNSYRYYRIDANSASGTTVQTNITAAAN